MNSGNPKEQPNHEHAWRGTWDRPMAVDEDALDPFTVARMTDHNVRGMDESDEAFVKKLESPTEYEFTKTA